MLYMKKFIKENWLLILSLLYVLSPIDLLPEFILGPLGIVDDLGLILLLLTKAFFFRGKENKV